MTHYQDIHVLPDAEIGASVLMSALFFRLHMALVTLRSDALGISFPEFSADRTLGTCLRLHGTSENLHGLERLNWTERLVSYVHKESVTPVPEHIEGYRVVRRKQVKSSPERLRRRYARRHGLSEEEVDYIFPESIAQTTTLPFVSLKSKSTGQPFRLFIEHSPLGKEATGGVFSTYGLSRTATVPWF